MGDREILDSWKAISNYLKRDIRTCQRYERELQLPVHRLEGSPRARVFAYPDELDVWRKKKPLDPPGITERIIRFIKAAPFMAAAVIILAVALGWLFHSLRWGRPEGKESGSRLLIAVLPFQNSSGRPDLDKWTLVLPHLLTQGLTGSKYFGVLGDDKIAGVIRGLGLDPETDRSFDDLRRIEAECGATHAITVRLVPAGKGLVIALTTKKIGSDEIYSSRFECEDEAGIVLAADRMADQVKRDLGLTRTTQAGDFDATGVPVTTSSLEAFRLYNQGRRYHVAGDYVQSAELMRRAIDLDPEFALAWRSLASSLGSQGAEAEAGECLATALDFSSNASLQERYFIKTTYFQHKAQFGRALQASREWSTLYPDDTQARLFTGRACLFEEDAEGARRELDEALQRGDRNPFLYFYASLASTALGRHDEAAMVRERGLSVHPDNRLVAGAGVIDAIVQGLYATALSRLNEMRDQRPNPNLDLKTGDVLLLKGDFRDAERSYTSVRPLSRYAAERLARLSLAEGRYSRAAELAREAGNPALLSYAECRRGRVSEGLAAALEALRPAEELGQLASMLVALFMKGAVEATAGDFSAAEATVARLIENGRSGLERAHRRAACYLRGVIAAAEGRAAQAVEELGSAVALLPRDVPYLDDQPYMIGLVAGTHAIVLYTAAQAYEKAGNPQAALGLYQRVTGLNGGRLMHPDLYALSHCALGRIAEAAGDLKGARQSYAKFLDLWKNADPGLPEVEEARARLAALDRSDKK